MSNHSNGLRMSTLRLFLLVLCFLSSRHCALADPQRVEDADQRIIYFPSSAWFSNSNCPSPTCLNPGGVATSWHEGIAVGNDPDRSAESSSGSGRRSASSTFESTLTPSNNQLEAAGPSNPLQQTPSSGNPPQQNPQHAAQPASPSPHSKSAATGGSPAQATTPTQASQGLDDDVEGGKYGDGGSLPSGSYSGPSNGDKRNFLNPRVDANEQIMMFYNFTGSAISIYGVLPPASLNAPTTPTNINLTITLDNQTQPNFQTASASGSTTYENVVVYSSQPLSDGLHQLVVTVNPNSTFIFDYIIVNPNATTSSTNPTSSPMGQSSPSGTDDLNTKKHNVATFAGAVGGSVGVLALFALGLAISIIRRRRRSVKRDRRDHGSLHTNSSDDSPHHMSGPAPFVPRFFPGTVIPAEPPTYNAAVASNRADNPVLTALSGSAYESRHRSYADIPPETPPPPEDEPMIMPPPPPFTFPEESVTTSSSISSPICPRSLAAAESHPASTMDTEGTSQQEGSVGTELANSAATPELEPLLQPSQSHNNHRSPDLRTSSRSTDPLPPLPPSPNASRVRVNVDQEDIS